MVPVGIASFDAAKKCTIHGLCENPRRTAFSEGETPAEGAVVEGERSSEGAVVEGETPAILKGRYPKFSDRFLVGYIEHLNS